MSAASQPDYSSSLFYTVSHDDGTSIRVVCLVKSADSCQLSKEVNIKITPTTGPKEYTAGTKWALLVANTNYVIDPLPPLFTPSSDMQLIAKELKDLDFHCLLLTNLNLVEFKNAVKLFSNLVKPGDYVVFCYAGHGLYSGIDLLMPVPDKNSDKELETLSSVWVRTVLQRNDPALLFVVLDMCRHIHVSNVEGSGEGLKTPAHRNCVVLHATSEGYQSLEDPKTSSVLTSSLVQHLKDNVDVVNMAREVLEDIAHKSKFVRREQIPKLDVSICDGRSLRDPQASFDSIKERVWSSLVAIPQERISKKLINGKELTVRVDCLHGGVLNLVSNVMLIQLQVFCEGLTPRMSLALNVAHEIKPVGRKENKVVYEMAAIHKLKEPLVLMIQFKDNESNEVIHENLHLGLPGIAKVKIYDKNYDAASLQTKNLSHNIP